MAKSDLDILFVTTKRRLKMDEEQKEMIEECFNLLDEEEDFLTNKQYELVESFKEWYFEHGFLTDKQLEVLDSIAGQIEAKLIQSTY